MRLFAMTQLDDGEFAHEIVALVKRLDLGIQNISVKKSPLQPETAPDGAFEIAEEWFNP